MPSPFNRFEGISIFDDKGEVKRLVESVLQRRDLDVTIVQLRKLDFSYIFGLSGWGRTREFEILRTEIEASWDWRNGNIDESIEEKLEKTIKELR